MATLASLTPLVVIMTLAFLVESLTEYFFANLCQKLTGSKDNLKYVAAIVGVIVAILYQVDAIEKFLGLTAVTPYVGCVLTGLMLGRGGNFVHDFYSRITGPTTGPPSQ